MRARNLCQGTWRVTGLLLLVAVPALAQPRITRLIVPRNQTLHEQALTTMLVEEAQRRTADGAAVPIQHTSLATVATGEQAIVLADRDLIEQLLPRTLLPAWRAALVAFHPTQHPQAFSAVTVIVLAANNERGELFAADYLLRKMSFATGFPQLPHKRDIFCAPDKPIRGHQIG